ncbi:hypothetical protein M0804_004956 [Polistes exclamans]|nr:hypothetical protein M0804_004956 [Polistes exclamans]
METNNKIQYLIVDTSAFIKNAPLQDIGVNIITEQDVVNEITNKRQLRRLVVLPYDLSVESAFPENIKFVTEFAKKTGDYTSLSATDVKVIALTYQLEKEKVGTEHLKETPTIVKTINKNEEEVYVDSLLVNEVDIKENEEGQEEKENKNDDECLEDEEDRLSSDATESSDDEYVSNNETATSDVDDNVDIETKDLTEKFSNLNCEPSQLEIQSEDGNTHNVDDILATISDEENKDSLEESNESDDDCNNDNDWITPNNIKNVRKQMDSDVLKEKSATVACLTMDFAMQNVLMQIGLNVASLDGKVIKQMRTFIFRCYACFKTTSIMTKVFCPNCGNKTLKKVAISLDDNGKQQIHINTRRPLTAKGKKFSLPKPQGGKHANNPILCEDQPMPQQRISKLARTKNDPLYDDYIAGFSPFVTRDVYSKSAMLGIRSNGGVKYWMKKNPNESRKKRK